MTCSVWFWFWFFWYNIFKIPPAFHTYSTSQFRRATFFSGHWWPWAIILDRVALEVESLMQLGDVPVLSNQLSV